MDEARALLASLGMGSCAPALEALLGRGEEGLAALLAALVEGAPIGGPRVDPRALEDELEECLCVFARQAPVSLVREVLARPALHARPEVLAAVSLVPGEAAAGLLLDATGSSDARVRWRALESLARRQEPRLASCAGRLILDRDSLVAFEARRWALCAGGVEHLAPLVEVLRRMPPASGHYVQVMDTIEVICLRASQPLPAGFPARISAEPVPPGVAFDDPPEHTLFPAGVELGRGPDGPFVAPRDWFVVTTLPPRAPGTGLVVLLRDRADLRIWIPPGAR